MQIISKGGRVYCRTFADYPAEIVKNMKSAGYKVKEVKEKEVVDNGKEKRISCKT